MDQVHELLLTAIVEGNLAAGHELRDHVLAEHFGLSRTPIREAIKRLEHQGIVAVAAARYTRLVSFAADQVEHVVHDWAAAHFTLVDAIVKDGDRGMTDRLEAAHDACREATGAPHIAASFRFFEHLRAASRSFSVGLSATTAAYRLRLALPQLPDPREPDLELHARILSAMHRGRPADLSPAFASWQRAMGHPGS